MHTSLEILEIKLVFYLLFCCTIYNIRERVVSDIRTSSGRRELVYLIQHGRECCKWFRSICYFVYFSIILLYHLQHSRACCIRYTNFEREARISIPDTTRPRMLQIDSICSFVYFSITSYHLQHSRACCIEYMNFEPKARISISDTTRPRMLQML